MPTISEPIYCTVAEVLTELGAVTEELPDKLAIQRSIEDAEDLIDRLLGGWLWAQNEQTGRKVTEGDVMAWQWAKLTRATVKLSARLYRDPTVVEQVYENISGPDFATSGPKGAAVGRLLGVQVLALIDDSGLRRIAGRARQGRGLRRYRSSWERFFTATRHDGT